MRGTEAGIREGAGRLAVDGIGLEYRHIGPSPADAPTLVLLHEGLGSVSIWRDFPDRLAAVTGCGVFVYSRQGYGGSDAFPLPRTARYMHDEGEIVLPAVLDAIGFRRGLTVGHSDGASIAAIHAGATRDARLAGIALMAPHFFIEASNIEAIRQARAEYEEGPLRERLARHHGENVDNAFYGWNEAWLSPAFQEWDLRDYLPKIVVPLLAIQGEADPYGTMAQAETAVALSGGPARALPLPGCGHSPYREQPEQTLAAIAEFVETCLKEG